MASINKVILIGNLIKAPEVRQTNNGVQVATIVVATNEKYKDTTGTMQERTEFHNIVAWDKKAELCAKYLSKGKLVYVEGKIKTEKYVKDGRDVYSTKIVMDNVQFLSPAGQSSNANQAQSNDPFASNQNPALSDIPF